MGQNAQSNPFKSKRNMNFSVFNDNKFRLEIPGQPIPKLRARHKTKRADGKALDHVKTYDPQSKIVKSLQMELFVTLRTYHRSFRPWTGPLEIHMIFFMEIPKNWPKYKIMAIEEQHLVVWHESKPDTSNLQKFYEDAFNDILWADDSQIARSFGHKRYATKPGTIIECQKLKNPNWKRIKNLIHAVNAAMPLESQRNNTRKR